MSEQPPPQAQWSPPPPPQAGWGTGGPMAPQRPTGVTLGAIFLIVMGVLMALFGAACGLLAGAVGSVPTDIPGMGALGLGLATFGIIVLVIGIIQIAAGAGALGGKSWARWTGIVISVIVVVFSVLGVVSALGAGLDISSMLMTIVIGALYALTAWALFSASAFFAYRR